MNAEALIGTTLGTCTLQRLLGQGGMGAVYLAQQSRPRRQVAVKVLMPMAPLSPNHLAAFLERFRRETDAAASLEHPNIVPVHEYGERDGLAYLVMPYISGGTLRDELEREGQLPLAKIMHYLDQIAAALDFAHEHGVIHRDIKPANILMTPEGRLLLTDFGLVKIVAEGQAPQIRLTGAGAPVGTPDYMSPEQVIGDEVDARADLYSFGVILYQMVTGTTPFQGETPMQIAAQHLQVSPPSPQVLRPDLPASAEQVILRAMAKRPADRYETAQELADAFRLALIEAGIQLTAGLTLSTGRMIAATGNHRAFEKIVESGQCPALPVSDKGGNEKQPAESSRSLLKPTGVQPAITSGALPAANAQDRPAGGGLLSRTGKFPIGGSYTGGGLLSRTGKFPLVGTGTGMIPAANVDSPVQPRQTGSLMLPYTTPAATPGNTAELRTTTGTLAVPGPGGTNSVKLTSPVKVVKVPVAGQPGRFVTGLLPVVPPQEEEPAPPPEVKREIKPWTKWTALLLVVLVLIGTAGTFWFVRMHTNQQATGIQRTKMAASMPDAEATATAAAQANIILSDPLSQNIHNWQTTPADVYAFKDGAYHITDHDNNGRATVLQANPFTGPLGYTLTMQEIKGDDTSLNNSYGMIFRFNQQTTGGKTVTKFYTLEVVNMPGGEYQFWRYDDSQGQGTSPWTKIWHHNFGHEFHQGHGSGAINTFKVFMNGNNFTFTVNGTRVGTAQDGALSSGTVGMIVNLNGTEVAFKDLLLTRN